jgi:hypothetical protein
MALTCGEETAGAFNGAQWLAAAHERDLIDAEFGLNEGAGGELTEDGKPVVPTSRRARRFPVGFGWRSPTPAATPRGRCGTTPSTASPTR